jgi:hypothetical protein
MRDELVLAFDENIPPTEGSFIIVNQPPTSLFVLQPPDLSPSVTVLIAFSQSGPKSMQSGL